MEMTPPLTRAERAALAEAERQGVPVLPGEVRLMLAAAARAAARSEPPDGRWPD